MSELVATAERLRVVKSAFLEFIELWAIDQLMNQRASRDWITDDVMQSSRKPENGDFSCLYQGRGLDD